MVNGAFWLTRFLFTIQLKLKEKPVAHRAKASNSPSFCILFYRVKWSYGPLWAKIHMSALAGKYSSSLSAVWSARNKRVELKSFAIKPKHREWYSIQIKKSVLK